jgi:chromosome segregation ATPase
MNKVFRLVVILVLSSVAMVSCRTTDECKQMAEENAILKQSADERDKQVEDIISTMNSVEQNLSQIEQAQKDIINIKDRSSEDQQTRIAEMLVNITDLSTKNKAKVDELEVSLKKQKVKSKSLQKLINKLKQEIEKRDAQIEELRNSVAGLSEKVDELTTNLREKEENISRKDEEIKNKSQEIAATKKELEAKENALNTGYFLFGTKKDLVSNGVVKKEGGVLGVGKSLKLNSNFDKGSFTSINI